MIYNNLGTSGGCNEFFFYLGHPTDYNIGGNIPLLVPTIQDAFEDHDYTKSESLRGISIFVLSINVRVARTDDNCNHHQNRTHGVLQ